MELSAKKKQYLKGLAHSLSAVVQLGRGGLTPAVIAQMNQALDDHELIKIKLGKECPQTTKEVSAFVVPELKCQMIQTVGRVMVLFRRHPKKPKVDLPRG